MLETDTVAAALFEKIRSKFEDVSVGDEDSKATVIPAKARFFNFEFISTDGQNFGNITISLIEEGKLKVVFGKNISADLNEQQKAEWYEFLRDLRFWAKRHLLSWDPHDISRKGLGIKDVKQLAVAEKPVDSLDASVTESKLYGSTKTSYETIAPGTRLIIRHSGSVDEAIHGARSRKIQSVYVEDAEGQRFKMPFTHLGGARALGRHIAHGGQIHDEFGSHTADLVQEMGKIRKFIQGSRNKTFEDHEATAMVQAAKDRYENIHHILHKLKGARGYNFYKESWKPSTTLQDDIDLESLRSKFVQKDFDNRLEDALPHVYRAYHTMKELQAGPAINAQIDEFSNELDGLAEGSWALPQDDMSIQKIQELMQSPLMAGIDGADATGVLYDILGDDDLFDRIYDASKGSPEMDVRPIVYDWLMANMPNVGKRIDADLGQGGDEGGAGDTPPPEAAPAPEEQQQPQESAEHGNQLSDIRRLAGLR
jgi:hypothetical protein